MDDQVYNYLPGADVPIDAPVDRIVSLVPAMTESLYDVNLGDKIVGVSDNCLYPADKLAAMPRVGRPVSPNIEQIIALEPELIFVSIEESRP